MYMTEAEIVSSYKRADNKKTQIKILAELNACEEKEIINILKQRKVVLQAAVLRMEKVVLTNELKNIRKMIAEGKTQRKIAQTYGVSQAKISKFLSNSKQKETELKNQLEEEKQKNCTITAELESWKSAAEELAQIIEANKAKEEREKEKNGFDSKYKRVSMGSF